MATIKPGWLKGIVDGVSTRLYAWSHAKLCYYKDPANGITVQDKLDEIDTGLLNHSHAWGAISNKPLDYPPSAHNHDERYYTETEVNALISAISTRLASAARFIGLYQQQIVLEANGEFFQAIPAQYQNGGYFYLINCSGNSVNFTANMEGYYMAAKNRGTGRLATTLQVYIFSTGI